MERTSEQPTRIALISDVHGNLPALEAVLADAAAGQTQAVWNLGDFLGYAPFPEPVIRRLRDAGAVSIVGNYDLKVLSYPEHAETWLRSKSPEKTAAFAWNYQSLSQESRRYLASLPQTLRLTVCERTVLLVHGSPESMDEHLTPATPLARLQALARLASADLVVCGHSHEAFARPVEGTWFINPGSVGRPEGGDWRASYALLDFSQQRLRVGHRRVEYDVESVVRAIRAEGLPKVFGQVLKEARSIDAIRSAIDRTRDPKATRRHRREVLKAATALAKRCEDEEPHRCQVTSLALRLAHALRGALGPWGDQERFWLRCAAVLHDIGWVRGRKGHHKTALDLILSDPGLPLGQRERRIVGLIARYHRRSLPQSNHRVYEELSPADRRTVSRLAAVLRVADALDASHTLAVRSIRCRLDNGTVLLTCTTRGQAKAEVKAAIQKGDLLEKVLGRTLEVRIRPGRRTPVSEARP